MMVVTVEDTSWALLFLEENTHQSGPNALGRLFNHSSLTGMFSNCNLSRLLSSRIFHWYLNWHQYICQYGRARPPSRHPFVHQVTTPTQPVFNHLPITQPSHSPINSSPYQSVIEFAHFSLYQSTKLLDSVFFYLWFIRKLHIISSAKGHIVSMMDPLWMVRPFLLSFAINFLVK